MKMIYDLRTIKWRSGSDDQQKKSHPYEYQSNKNTELTPINISINGTPRCNQS
jgi:hypothetical protein